MLKKTLLIAAALLLAAGLVAVSATGAKEVPLGSEENPLVWAFVPSGEMGRVTGGAQTIADMLHAETGLYFKTLVATEYAGVIEALRADPPTAHIASLATFSYILASDIGVAKAALVSVRRGTAFYQGQIIARVDSGIKDLTDLKGKSFARPDPLSTSGWIIPSIVLQAAGINLDRDIKIVDAGSHDAVVAAVYSGDVDAGACYLDLNTRIPMREMQKEHPDAAEELATLQISPEIPNDGVQFHPSVSEDMKDKIVAALLKIAETEEGEEALLKAYQWNTLEPHDDTFYDPFRQVLQAAGVTAEELMK
ncbi:MAG: phosphate/phosphite/phosphonate ABC transporter substrate-binding protein [Spirochaetales bacterium]|nr:phosphate/phosphite/phosphonate ABC transporter substrate-binding protein [Spirochaetales bacterium]